MWNRSTTHPFVDLPHPLSLSISKIPSPARSGAIAGRFPGIIRGKPALADTDSGSKQLFGLAWFAGHRDPSCETVSGDLTTEISCVPLLGSYRISRSGRTRRPRCETGCLTQRQTACRVLSLIILATWRRSARWDMEEGLAGTWEGGLEVTRGRIR